MCSTSSQIFWNKSASTCWKGKKLHQFHVELGLKFAENWPIHLQKTGQIFFTFLYTPNFSPGITTIFLIQIFIDFFDSNKKSNPSTIEMVLKTGNLTNQTEN